MARKAKKNWIGARTDDAFDLRVNAYLGASDELNLADLVRKGVLEYMENHPIKPPKKPVTLKPGA